MRGFLDDDESDGILLIDADNAFNRVNQQQRYGMSNTLALQ